MKNYMKRAVAILIVAIIVITSAPFNGFIFSHAEDIEENEQSTYETGDIIEFGVYPQSEVIDESLKNTLGGLINESDWTSYGYYYGNGTIGSMVQGDYMKYADVDFGGEKYRAVKFSAYRPAITYGTGYSEYPSQQTGAEYNTSYQHDNGYEINTVYFFKYEPLQWRVLDPYDGTIMCENIIDSQAFSNEIYERNNEYYSENDFISNANGFDGSSIKAWLNNVFYTVAFSKVEQNKIVATKNDYTGQEQIKLFIIDSFSMRKVEYGFSSDSQFYDPQRQAKGTEYAKCQGLWVNDGRNSDAKYKGNSFQMTIIKSSTSKDIVYVGSGGVISQEITEYSNVCNTSAGVRPVCRLSSLSYENPKIEIDEDKVYRDSDFIHYGSPLFHDSAFNYSTNGMETYSNFDHNAISIEKVNKDNECPTNSLYMMRITKTGVSRPGLGGFVQPIEKKEGGVFYHVIIANVPEGFEVDAHSNTLGVGGHIEYLTDMKGTGHWKLYIFKINYGLLFQSAQYGYNSGYVYIKECGTVRHLASDSDNNISWYVGYANVFDNTGDKCFSSGAITSADNEIWAYNNNSSNSNNVTVSNVSASADCPTTSGNMIQIKTTAGSSRPGLGGFYKQVNPEADRVYYHKMMAKIPEGFQLSIHRNALSANFEWITSNQGTGKWETYIYRVKVDKMPTDLGTFGFVALYPNNSEGIYNSETGNYDFNGSVTWYLAYNNIYQNFEFSEDFKASDLIKKSQKEYNDHLYVQFPYQVSWHMAKALCERMGGHLATITSDEENTAVNNLISPSEMRCWLGATDEETEGTWKWVTGESFSFKNWNSSQPDNYTENDFGAENYLHMYVDGKWNDVYPSYKTIASFVCEFDNLYIPAKTVEKDGHFYSLYNECLSWTEAEAACVQMGGHLVSITSEEEQRVVNEIVEGQLQGLYWIGARTIDGSNWSWSSGETFDYSHWGSGEPNGTGATCAQVYSYKYSDIKDTGDWNDELNSGNGTGFYALNNTGFICEVDITNLKPNGSCLHNGTKYEVYDTTLTWMDAKRFAEIKGGHLLTINDQKEQDCITRLVSNASLTRYYMGAQADRLTRNWSWVTGEEWSYTNWNVSMPNCQYGIEFFGQIYNQDGIVGKWNDLPNKYSEKTGFIIEYEDYYANVAFDENNGKEINCFVAPTVDDGWIENSDGKLSVNYGNSISVVYDPSDETFTFDTNGESLTSVNDNLRLYRTDVFKQLIKENMFLSLYANHVSGNIICNSSSLVFEGIKGDDPQTNNTLSPRCATEINTDNDYFINSNNSCPSGPFSTEQSDQLNGISLWLYIGQGGSIRFDNYKIKLMANITDQPVETPEYSRLAQKITNGSVYGSLLYTPERTGYTFADWKSGETTITAETQLLKTENHILSANWDVCDYLLSFNANGGSCDITNKTVYYDSEIGELPVPTRDGYTFVGWYTKKKGGSLVRETDIVKTASDRTVYACWSLGESNACGDNATWRLDGNTLIISGTGDMYDYTVGNTPWYNLNSYISEIKIEKGVTGIGNNAFNGMTGAESVSIADSVTDIGDGAFKSCLAVTELVIPESVTTIGESAFENMSLTELIIPHSVQSVGDCAFDGCHHLDKITVINPNCILPEYWMTNNEDATVYGYGGSTSESFADESDVNFVEIGKYGVVDDFEWLYTNESKILDIYGTGAMPDFNGKIAPWTPFAATIEKVVFHEGITYIGNYALTRCENVSNISAPKTLKNLGEQVFEETQWFADQDDGIVTLRTVLYAYKGASESRNIVLGNGITAISKNFSNSFENGNVSPESIQISATVTDIDYGALAYASELTTLIVNAGNKTYKSNKNVLYSKDGSKLLCYPAGCDGNINIPDSVTEIADFAFSGCDNLTEIKFGKKISVISDKAFESSGLATIYGYSGSYPEEYAQQNGYEFVPYKSKVTLDWNDRIGTQEELIINTGCNIGELREPSNEGFVFTGWYLETDDEDLLINSDFIVNDDITLYAYWEKQPEEEAYITSISIHQMPSKTEYFVGDNLINDGIKIVVNYSDGTEKIESNGYLCVPSKLNTSGEQVVRVMYSGFETEFNVSVLEIVPVSISILTLPKTTTYYAGDHLNPKGLSVEVDYNNGTQRIIKNTSVFEYEYDLSTPSTATDVNVKFEENGKTVSTKYQVEVKQCPHIYSVDLSASSGDEISVPVYISGNQGIMGYVIRMEYNPNVFTPVGIPQSPQNGSIGYVVKDLYDDYGEQITNKSLEIIWYSTSEFGADGLLFTQLFKVNSKAESGNYDICLSFSKEETFNENFDNIILQCSDAHIAISSVSIPNIYSNELDGTIGETIEIPLYFENNVGIEDTSILTVRYDPAAFDYVDCQNGVGTIFKSTNSNGTIKIILNEVDDSVASGLLLKINMRVLDTAQVGSSTISLTIDDNNWTCESFSVNISKRDLNPQIVGTNASVVGGETFEIPVSITDNSGLMGYRFEVSYDTSKMKFINASCNENWSNGNFEYNEDNGIITIIWFSTENVTADGEMFNLTFKAKSNPRMCETDIVINYSGNNTYNSDWSNVLLDCNPITITIDVNVLIEAVAGSGTQIDYSSNYIYGITSSLIDLDGRVTVKNGYTYSIDNTYERIGTGSCVAVKSNNAVVEKYTVILFGDVNGDGWYDGRDSFIVDCIVNGLLTREQVGEAKWMAADCNHDGEVNSSDVLLLEQAGLLLANVDQTMSQDELMQSDSYIEYLNLIDQNPAGEEPNSEEPTDPEPTPQTFLAKLIEILQKVITFIRSLFPKI